MDIADIAAERQEIEEARMFAAREKARKTGKSREDCEECGELIPEDRRMAVEACTLCIHCARSADLRRLGVRRG